jgi:cysteine synthase B
MMGTTRRLREYHRMVICIAVQPAEALHGLEGLKHMESSIVPPIYNPEIFQEMMTVKTEDGWDMAQRVAAEEGLHVGHSTGANIYAALKVAERIEREQGGGCVVTIACDRGDRYFAATKWERRYLW